jgi:hypothetical protein
MLRIRHPHGTRSGAIPGSDIEADGDGDPDAASRGTDGQVGRNDHVRAAGVLLVSGPERVRGLRAAGLLGHGDPQRGLLA